jgi:hypothetical protein
MTNQIIKGFGQGLKQLGQETVEKIGEESQKILESTITGKELLGLDGGVSDEEINQKKQQDEVHKQEEMNKIKAEMGQGRNVEGEIEQIRKQRESEEEEKEKIFLENLKRQREMERQQQMDDYAMMETPKKHHVDKGGNKHKTQQPDPTMTSQTSEFKGGKID